MNDYLSTYQPRSYSHRICPACYLPVRPNDRNIENHWDTIWEPCPGSGEPYRITYPPRPLRKKVAA